MKKILTALSCLALAAMVSCQKEILTDGNAVRTTNFKGVTLTVGTGSEDTKVTSENLVTKWSTGDEKMCVLALQYDTVAKYQFIKPEGAKTPLTAEFSCDSVDAAATLKYALYPYSNSANFAMGANEVLTLYADPAVSYNAVNSIPSTTMLAGKLSGTSVTMKNACAFLKLTLPDSTNGKHLFKVYSHLKVEGSGVSGKFTAKFEDDSLVVLSKGNTDEIKVRPRAKDTLSYGAVYIPVVPGTYDTLKISLFYYDHRGLYTFSRTSKTAQTFKSNNVYDLHEFAGPLAESATTGLFTINGTTLTMNGSATVWKYAGVTNSNYGFKFLYREAGAADWDSVDATPSGDGQQVTFTADVTIDTTKTYEYKAQVTACATAVEGEINATSLKFATVLLSFDFSNISSFMTKYKWSYDSTTIFANCTKATDDKGADCFPTFNANGKTKFYYRTWNGTNWSDTTSKTGTGTYMIGSRLSATDSLGNSYNFEICPTGKSHYYTLSGKKLCMNRDTSNIKICCPPDKAILSVTITANKSSDTRNWGLGDKKGSDNIVKKTAETDYTKPLILNVPEAVKGRDLWLYGGTRAETITVEFVY